MLPWVADGVAGIFEPDAVRLVQELERLSPAAFGEVWSTPRQWLPPRSGSELATLRGIVSIAGNEEAVALALLNMPFLQSVEWVDLEAVRYLDRLGQSDQGALSELMSNQVFADGIEDEEAILVPMAYLGMTDPDARARLGELPWVADGISYREPEEALKVLILVEAALNVRDTFWALTGKTWMQNYQGAIKRTVMEEIVDLAREDEQLTLRLLAMPFLDQFDNPDSSTWSFLAGRARESGEQLDYILAHPTFAQGISDENQRELTEVYWEIHDGPRYATDKPVWPLAIQDGKLPKWVLDPRSPREAAASEILGQIWLSHPAMAEFLTWLPWIADGVDEEEEEGRILQIRGVIEADEALARDLEAFWSVNGFSDTLLWHVQYLASMEPLAARRILELPWVADGISQAESNAIGRLSWRGRVDLELLDRVLGFPWILDEVAPVEAEAVQNLALIWWSDNEMGKTSLGFPWVADGITRNEAAALLSLGALAYSEYPTLASDVIDKLQGVIALDRDAVSYAMAAVFLLSESPEDLRAVADSSWFADGVDVEDAAFLAVLAPLAYLAPEFYRELLESRFTVNRSITLPLGGETHLWAFHYEPFSSGSAFLDVVEEAVRHTEALMGTPFPTSDVIILAGAAEDYLAEHAGDHIVLSDRIVAGWAQHYAVIWHEIAHYYFDDYFGHVWLREGSAEYAANYIGDSLGGGLPWERRRGLVSRNVKSSVCGGIETIAQLHEIYDPVRDTPQCAYILGENFLNETRLLIGEDALHSTLRDIYLWTATDRAAWPSEEDIYGIFLGNVPERKQDAFKALYDRLHGGRTQ